ncbi:MAG: biotin/lipoyl-binding protein, partial [Actinomycetia bacterium]|nr:biotin/lipoyl-binding protein [Actinomycetes bacterium]
MTEEQVQQIATQIDQIDQIEIETESTDQVGPIEVADQVEVVAFEGAALPKPDEDRRIKQAWWWALALGLLGLLAIAGVYLYLESQVPTIEVATVEKSALTIEVTGSGQIEPDDPTDVYSKQAGIVSALHVSDGQKVIKGAPLIELDRAPLQAQLVLAEGSLAQARAGLAQAQSGAFSRSEAINAAVQGVNAAEAGLATAYEIKVLADQSVIDAQYFLDILKSYPNPDPFDIMQAEGALEQARVGQQQAIGGIAAAEGSVAAARGALAQAQSSDPDAAISAANAAIAASEEQVALAR